MLTYEDVKNNSAVRTYIQRADESLTALGYTEHSFAHVTAVAENAAYILSTLGYPERTVELAKIFSSFSIVLSFSMGFSTSLRVEVEVISTPPTTMVSFLSYSTMVACSLLKAYRAAS